MDHQRFDVLVRSLAIPGSRRAALRLLGAGALGLGGVPGGRETDAKQRRRATDAGRRPAVDQHAAKKKKKKCKPPCGACATCKKGTCAPKSDGAPCSGGTCQAGVCVPDSGSCSPACSGGRVCANGTCACPPDKPHSGGGCDDTCRACCSDDDCGRFSGMVCDHNQGSICRCGIGFDCGQGLCWPCCSDQQCTASGFPEGDGFYCDVETHSCQCQAGKTMCDVGPNGITQWSCLDLSSNDTCGFTCNQRPPCTGGTECINHQCQFPG